MSWFLVIPFMIVASCDEEDSVLAPYAGGVRELSNIFIQDSVFTPKITWLGGYVSALGVNRGNVAILDTSLLWIVRAPGNTLRFPVTFGQVPEGAEDLTSRYGGRRLDELQEDKVYTFWVLKEDAWSLLSEEVNKPLFVDSLVSTVVEVRNDTLFVSPLSHTQTTQTLDVYINLKDFRALGSLAIISIEVTNTSNDPVVSYTIRQPGVTDSLVAAVGLVEGSQYDVNLVVWEVLSQEVVGGTPVYRTKNVIRSPFVMGQQFSETRVFVEYPAGGLQRDKDYYFWIANKDWDGVNRLRSTLNYAYATFHTW